MRTRDEDALARRTSSAVITDARTRMIAPRTPPIMACFAFELVLPVLSAAAMGVVCNGASVVAVEVLVGTGIVEETPLMSG